MSLIFAFVVEVAKERIHIIMAIRETMVQKKYIELSLDIHTKTYFVVYFINGVQIVEL